MSALLGAPKFHREIERGPLQVSSQLATNLPTVEETLLWVGAWVLALTMLLSYPVYPNRKSQTLPLLSSVDLQLTLIDLGLCLTGR